MTKRVLIVDDDAAMCRMLEASLGKRGFDVMIHTQAEHALEALRAHDPDVVVTDLNMRGMNGLELCERILGDRPDIPVIVITAFGSLDSAIGAIRAGAYDFVPKPFEIDVFVVSLERAIQHRELNQEVKRLRTAVAESRRFHDLLGDSPAMRKVYEFLDRIRDSEASVLISGESGTGKELVAQSLHKRSRRHDGPFVAINCAAMPETLLESELFGHARGAFTDAKTARVGLFVQAHEGTLFLDEIGELPLGLQPKLLRALQERKVRPLGADTEVSFDVRICAATNRDLETAVEEKRFREDLFYRLNVIHVDLPPLRSRGNDMLVLGQHFLERFAAATDKPLTGISAAAAEKLLSYQWPGNVRELQNCIERAVALAQFEEIVVDDLPDRVRNHKRSHMMIASDDPDTLVPMEEVERRYIERVLQTLAGNKTAAAKVLGFDRTTLYRKLERYGLVDTGTE